MKLLAATFFATFAFFLPFTNLRSEVIQAPEQRFLSVGSQPVFPVGNLNIFKQYETGFDVHEQVGDTVELDLGFTSFEFGGEVEASFGAHFGLEFGVCVGGSTTFDIGFQPTVVIPDIYPYEVKIPITVTEGFRTDSRFQTDFPSLGSMYADLILDISAGVRAEACVFGCFTPIDISLSTCDLPGFNESIRCDPSLDVRKYCALELGSINRQDSSGNSSNEVRVMNVLADNGPEFLLDPLITYDLGANAAIGGDGDFGEIYFAAPTVVTDSNDSAFNTSQVLKSSGAEDIVGISIDVVKVASELVFPPTFPKISDGGSLGPIDWNYALATLKIGPAVQLGMDFEMTWDVVVTEMEFNVPGTSTGRNVRLYTPPGSAFPIGDDPMVLPPPVSRLSQISGAVEAFTLTNCGPRAIPMVYLFDANPVEVKIFYELRPKLKTVVSLPFVGKLSYGILSAGAEIKKVGDFGFGPLIRGDHKFKFGEFEVYNGDAFDIQSAGTGGITFTLQAAGPPSFDWNPLQWTTTPVNTYSWTARNDNNITNWAELVGGSNINFPGAGGGMSSAVMIDQNPQPRLDQSLVIDTLSIYPNRGLEILSVGPHSQLGVQGLLENNGFIQLGANTSLLIDSTDAVLCGAGLVFMYNGGSIIQQSASNPSTFCNYNHIEGVGRVMDNYVKFRSQTTTMNAGKIIAAGGGYGTNGSNALSLRFDFDSFADDTSWEIRIEGGGVIASGSGYTQNNSSVTIPLNIPNGDYVLTVFDSFEDGNGSYTLSDSTGTILASGNNFPGADESKSFLVLGGSYLKTAADTFINENEIGAKNGALLLLDANNLKNPIGSVTSANGGTVDLRARNVEHAGKIEAIGGGRVEIGPVSASTTADVFWQAGQSFRKDCGHFLAIGGVIELDRINMFGGCFFSASGGNVTTSGSEFFGGVFEIGDTGSSNASLSIDGSEKQIFHRSCLNNFGTLTVNGYAEFENSLLFANHGTVRIPQGGRLHIMENFSTTPGASAAALSEPGTANATADTIIGGTWDISGQLDIDGANFLFMGADNAPASSSSGSVGTDGVKVVRNVIFDYYDLQILSVSNVSQLPAVGTSQLIIASVGGQLHVRIYNTQGVLALDKTESQLIPGTFRDELKAMVDTSPLPLVSSLPQSEMQMIIEHAAVIADYAPEMDSNPTAILSRGEPANIILRGPFWKWNALETLQENRGTITLVEGADFRPNGDFTNCGLLTINSGSVFDPNGKFVQIGADALTVVNSGGLLRRNVGPKIYEICGGTLRSTGANRLFNTFGGELQSGNTLMFMSPLIDTNEETFVQERVIIDSPDDPITSIEDGAFVTLHGAAVEFDALTDNLILNDGELNLIGEGSSNAAVYSIASGNGETLTNTGSLKLLGYTSRLTTRNFTQTGNGSVTQIGAGATLDVEGLLNIDGGELILDIGSRPGQGNSATVDTFVNNANFGDGLVINFTEELAVGNSTVDIGDSWDILPRNYSGNILGIATIETRLDGETLPVGWLPPNSHLEISRYPNNGNPRGLRVRIAPDNGFVDYSTWAISAGLDPVTFESDPFRLSANGTANISNFLYGENGGSKGVSFTTGMENGIMQRYACFSFTRPLGTEANYLPYYSLDLVKWEPAAMVLTPGSPPVVNGDIELVTMKSIYPSVEKGVFFRIQADVNPDNFGDGRIPEKPITHTEALRNFTPPNATQPVTAGNVLYFNVNGSNDNSGSLFFGGTAPDGVTRNFIYKDRSRIDLAAVHAGLIRRNQRGIIKVTFLAPQQTIFLGSTQNILSETGSIIDTITSRTEEPEGEAYSYKVELHEAF